MLDGPTIRCNVLAKNLLTGSTHLPVTKFFGLNLRMSTRSNTSFSNHELDFGMTKLTGAMTSDKVSMPVSKFKSLRIIPEFSEDPCVRMNRNRYLINRWRLLVIEGQRLHHRNPLRRHGGTSQHPTYSYRARGKMSPPQCSQARVQGCVVASCSRSRCPEDHQPETVPGQEHGKGPSRIPLVLQMNCATRPEVLQVVLPEQKIPRVQSDV